MNRALPSLLLFALLLSAVSASAATRVATLIPSVERALTGLDGVEVVASVRTSMRQPERTDVVDLGNAHRPSLERLAVANADVIIGDSQLHAAQREPLGRFGAEVVLLDMTSVDATFADLAALGEKLGVADALRQRTDGARQALAGLAIDEPVSVLALFGTPGSFLVSTDRTWLGSLLADLGFENLGTFEGKEKTPGYVAVSHEKLAELRPQLIVMVVHGDPRRIQGVFEERVAQGGAWHGLTQDASYGVHVLDPRLFSINPVLALPEAGQSLVGLVDGSAASGVSAGPPR